MTGVAPAPAQRGSGSRSRATRVARAIAWLVLGVIVFAIVAVIGGALFVGSETGLPYVIRQITRLTDGKLAIDGARGSLLSRLQIDELRWRGATTTVIARDVVVVWQPAALTRRELHVESLGARSVELAIAPSQGGPPPQLPRSLGLPLSVVIDDASVTTFDWKLGERAGRVTGIAFGYRGDANQHQVSGVTLGFDRGRLAGNARLDAARPFATTGRITFAGSDDLDGIGADATIGGTLARIVVNAGGQARDARFTAQAQLTPFAAAALDTLDIDASQVDLATFDPAWPHSSFALTARARPAAGGFAGSFSLANAQPGSIDAGRIPLLSMSANFAQDDKVVTLRDIDARLGGGGRASGSAVIGVDPRNASATLALTLASVDLRAIHGSFAATRVGGSLRGKVDADAQVFEGELADNAHALSLTFAARIAGGRAVLSRARVSAAAGTLDGHGEMALAGTRAFTFDAHASRFDPAKLGAFPAGALEGSVSLRGQLSPAWSVVADATLAPGARVGTQPASGQAHASLSADAVRDLALDLTIGRSRVQAKGNAGRAGDTLDFTVDAPALADIAPLLPASARRLRDGALQARGTLAFEPSGVSGRVDAHAGKLQFTDGLAIATLAITANVGSAHDAQRRPLALAQRALAIDVRATGVTTATQSLASVTAGVQGTLAVHSIHAELVNGTDQLALAAHGGLDGDTGKPLIWKGTVEHFDVKGTLPIALAAPAAVELSARRAHVGAASFVIAGGNVAVGDFSIDQGRVSTRGDFRDVPLATLARLAGQPLPVASTLTLQGEWSLAATPRINGTFTIRNQHGDLFASDIESPSAADFALGIRTLAIDAAAHDDAWTLDATLDSQRAGNATMHATLGPGANAGVPSLDAPLALRLHAGLASLAPLQPWIGSSAVVDGRVDLDVRADGTLRAPVLSGTFAGDGLRVDAPQWGIALADGRIRASLQDNVVTLDTFTFTGGDGQFTAHGTLARANGGGDGAQVAWHAERFRLQNRPDLRLVVSGDGTLAIAAHKLALAGKISVDEGHIEYVPSVALLGDDVVIKGRPRVAPAQRRARIGALQLDLDVDLGRAMTFSGEGLETALGGRVHVATAGDGALTGRGTIRTLRGTYFAFGQQLTIDRGSLIFDGPLDNPAIDIVALRKNLAVEAGVEITGTVRLPRIQLTSNPPVADGEKLSWLITGQAPGRGSASDMAALSAASSFLLGGNGRPIGSRIAQQLGLDDISLHSADSLPAGGATPANGQVVSIGKRLSDRLTLVYEQGLTVATNALRLEFALSRTLTLRVEAGTVSGIGIFFRRSYD